MDQRVATGDQSATPALGAYIISIRKRSSLKTFHHLRARYGTPGIDYQDWIAAGEARPPASAYTGICRQCWPVPGALLEPAETAIDPGASDSSSDERA